MVCFIVQTGEKKKKNHQKHTFSKGIVIQNSCLKAKEIKYKLYKTVNKYRYAPSDCLDES